MILTPSAFFTRPADVNAYSIGDLVANNVTAGSVVPMTFPVSGLRGGGVVLGSVRMRKSTVTATLATFQLHLWATSAIAPVGGDNAALSVPTLQNYLGNVALDMATGGQAIAASGDLFKQFVFADRLQLPGDRGLFGLLEARAAYVPASAEIFTVSLGLEA